MTKTWKPSDFIRCGWCQGAHAKDTTCRHREAGHPQASQWDILGAIGRARNCGFDPGSDAIERLTQAIPNNKYGAKLSLSVWNDRAGRTQADVINLLEGVGL